jgi:uncharacterized protein (DUF58 family)
MESRHATGRLARRVVRNLWPNQRLRWTREGLWYGLAWFALLLVGLVQQINLILLVAGLAFGPIFASIFLSAASLRGLRLTRRVPPYVFSGDALDLDYTLENDRRWTAALAMNVEDDLVPVDRVVSGSAVPTPRVFFPRVTGRGRDRRRWEGVSPKRGKYRFGSVDLVTRSPFGLLERRVTFTEPDELIVYPSVGQLSRRWHLLQREATQTRRGRRHDRTAQQQEYHGLREYRPGDSPRWIHWRTTARLAKPMVKEFEQQNEQGLAILLDPWLPRSKVTAEQREALEEMIRFAATVCLETCRNPGRRLLLGWTGATPGVRQGPASVKLLHELLEQLATMRPSAEGQLSALFDALPPATLREAMIVAVSTRPINLLEEAERSARLSGSSARGLLARVHVLDASKGDLADLIHRADRPSAAAPRGRLPDRAEFARRRTGASSDRPDVIASAPDGGEARA